MQRYKPKRESAFINSLYVYFPIFFKQEIPIGNLSRSYIYYSNIRPGFINWSRVKNIEFVIDEHSEFFDKRLNDFISILTTDLETLKKKCGNFILYNLLR